MEPLDGNAIAGSLFVLFDREMTIVRGACTHCGAEALIAELHVFIHAPGAVVRCRRCGNEVFVVTEIRGESRIDLDHFELLEASASGS